MLSPEGVKTVWKISQVNISQKVNKVGKYFSAFLRKTFIRKYHKVYISQRLKSVKTDAGDDWESQCKHITIYQVLICFLIIVIFDIIATIVLIVLQDLQDNHN